MHGFFKGKPCLSGLLSLLEGVSKDVNKHVDKGFPWGRNVEFPKVVVKVLHQRLLWKLSSRGFGGKSHLWSETW